MGVSVYVVGVRKKDEKYDKMMRVKIACDDAGTEYPEDLYDYFGGSIHESPEHVWEEMHEVSLREFGSGDPEYGDGFEIKVSDIPDDVVKIKVYMA